MNAKLSIKAALVVSTLVALNALAADPNDRLAAGDVSQMSKWYGRAGGLVGAERIAGLSKQGMQNPEIGISYDRAVAQRTNMSVDRTTGSVTITYDQAVAARTNMLRGQETTVRSAEVKSTTKN